LPTSSPAGSPQTQKCELDPHPRYGCEIEVDSRALSLTSRSPPAVPTRRSYAYCTNATVDAANTAAQPLRRAHYSLCLTCDQRVERHRHRHTRHGENVRRCMAARAGYCLRCHPRPTAPLLASPRVCRHVRAAAPRCVCWVQIRGTRCSTARRTFVTRSSTGTAAMCGRVPV
jgi:hypothetical protein